MEYNPTTIKSYLKEGGKLVLNNYGFFDTDLLTLRIKTKWGRRLIRWDLDTEEVAEAAQNTIDMYKGYLQEIFTFPNEYKIINPLHEETSTTMSYIKTGEGKEDTTKSQNVTLSDTINQKGNTSENGTFSENFVHGEVIDRTNNGTVTSTDGSTSTTTYGKTITKEGDNVTTSEGWKDVSTEGTKNTSQTGTTEENRTTNDTVSREGTTGGTAENKVAAYNQTSEYANRDLQTNSGTTEETTTSEGTQKTDFERNLSEKIDDNVHTIENIRSTDTTTIHETETYSGDDKTVINGNGSQNTTGTGKDTHSGTDKRTGENEKIGVSTIDTIKNGTQETSATINVDNNSTENYEMKEKSTKDGHVKFEEIIYTLDNLFNPYDWLGEKIVKTICEVFYCI